MHLDKITSVHVGVMVSGLAWYLNDQVQFLDPANIVVCDYVCSLVRNVRAFPVGCSHPVLVKGGNLQLLHKPKGYNPYQESDRIIRLEHI